jgi:hypothetical protein
MSSGNAGKGTGDAMRESITIRGLYLPADGKHNHSYISALTHS